VATFDDVRAIGLAFPETEEAPSYDGTRALKVRGTPFCRLWGPREHKRDGVSDTEVLVVFCDLDAKPDLIAGSKGVLFETPHYHGYGAMLVRLSEVSIADLAIYLEWSYRLRAPKRLAAMIDQPRVSEAR
jgi:hypothetical protein